MKHVGWYILLIILFCNLSLTQETKPKKDITVYVTKSGKKYHTEDCSYLKNKIPMKLSEAIQKYSPCLVCKPPTLEKKSTNKSESKIKESTSGRCQAITKKGTQCKREATPGSIYCWQHKK